MSDPGSGGFSIDGKRYTMDIGLSDEEGGEQGDYSSGDVHVDKTQKDISNPTKRALGEYLGRVTKGETGASPLPNRYPVDKNAVEGSIRDPQGYPSQLVPSENEAQFDPELRSVYSAEQAEIEFQKGKNSKNEIDGNDLLRSVTNTSSPVPTYQSAVLKNNRWYSPNSPLVGSPTPKQSPRLGSIADTEEVTFGRLATIGETLMLRATTELGATAAGFNPNSATADLATELPGPAQAAISKVNVNVLTAADILESLTTEEVTNFKDYSGNSWGSLNNSRDQFSGLAATGMITLSAALVAALQLSLEGLFAVFSSGQTPNKSPTKDAVGRYTLGSYYYGRKPKDTRTALGAVSAVVAGDLGTTLGIQPTTYPFLDCLKKGSRAFFGVDDSGSIGQAILAGFSRAVENPGFNVVICRTIIRSAASVVEKASEISGNPVAVAKQVIGMIDVLKGSKLIAACNVFAQLGDAILSAAESQKDPHAFGQKFSKVDANRDANMSAVQKSRLNNSLKLAWSGDRTNTLLLLPKNITAINQAGDNLGVWNKTLSAVSKNSLTSQKIAENGRLTQEQVEAQERKLDAEYVPFYFHDLRTNEIISFHAFLSSLTDSFAANFETGNPYGRVDPVMIYKNTQRSISFAFIAAATSQEDFDTMWLKINKLVTMLYPQYTEGKLITNGTDYTFRQPFSQQIGASPLIRLRIGDVIKSNYSRFALARLFGLGDPNMMLNGTTLANTLQSREDLTEYDNKCFEIAINQPSGLTFVPEDSIYEIYNDSNANVAVAAVKSIGGIVPGLGSSITNNSPKSLQFSQLNSNFMVTGVKKLDDFRVIGEISLNEDLPQDRQAELLKNKTGAHEDDISDNFIGGRYIIPISALRMTKKTRQKMFKKLVSFVEANNSFVNELTAFMSADINTGNAISKSFKSTGGKGLPGFIQNMNFEWIDNQIPWETSVDRVAPKICKISVTFAPLHDISPGIDAQGYNRGPVFPVGLASPEPERNK